MKNIINPQTQSSFSTQTIKSWPASERPRERLLESGPRSLSDAELMAILLRSGIQGKDAVSLSRELLNQFGGLRGLLSSDKNKLKSIKGLGQAKLAMLMAVTEIARRQLQENLTGQCVIRDPQSVLDYLFYCLRDKKREIFKVLFLDKAGKLICDRDLFEGTVDEAAVHPREVVKAALDYYATALILVHNHPSGRAEPSREDREITNRLKSACESVHVKILDHMIIGDGNYFSFREHQLI